MTEDLFHVPAVLVRVGPDGWTVRHTETGAEAELPFLTGLVSLYDNAVLAPARWLAEQGWPRPTVAARHRQTFRIYQFPNPKGE